MIWIILFVIVVLLASVARSARRTARRARRIPCVACGEALLPAARSCPRCATRQPLRGAVGMRERLWRA